MCEPRPFDPLDQAIVASAREHGVDVDTLHVGSLVRDYPFDPAAKCMSRVWEERRRLRIAAKGSVEGILERSAVVDDARTRAEAANERLGAEGVRVIAAASGEPTASRDRARDEESLCFAGIIGFVDPIRPASPRLCGNAVTAA